MLSWDSYRLWQAQSTPDVMQFISKTVNCLKTKHLYTVNTKWINSSTLHLAKVTGKKYETLSYSANDVN